MTYGENPTASHAPTNRRRRGAVGLVSGLLLAAILGVLPLGCGASPRPPEFNPGLPAYPPPFFTAAMPPPTLIGATVDRLRRAREVQERSAELRSERLFVEYLPRHPYALEVEYVVDARESRVMEMRLILDPSLRTDLGLRVALYGELLAAYGTPTAAEGTVARIWEFETYRLVWIADRLDIRRRDGTGSTGRGEGGRAAEDADA